MMCMLNELLYGVHLCLMQGTCIRENPHCWFAKGQRTYNSTTPAAFMSNSCVLNLLLCAKSFKIQTK